MRLEYCGQNASSLLRLVSRFSRMPQVWGSLDAKRRLRKGMANLTTKPCGVSFASVLKTVSNEGSKPWAFSPEGVGLNPKSVGEKSVSPAMIVEGIQHHLNRVIVKHVFPMRKPRPNFLRLTIEANKNHVQIPVVIAKVGLGAVRSRLTVAWSALNEALDLR